MNKLIQKRWIYHSVIWLALITLALISSEGIRTWRDVWELLTIGGVILTGIILSVYTAFYTEAHWFRNRKYAVFIVGTSLAIVLVASLTWLIAQQLTNEYIPWGQHIVNHFVMAFVALGLRYLKRGVVRQYQLQEARARQLESELEFLKAQMNPHFLFNTLNNLYGLNIKDPVKGSEVILSLSDLLRYQVSSADKKMVPLQEEVDFIHEYVSVERLRLTSCNNVTVNVEGVEADHVIAPMILIPFIENAFKYGTHSTQEATIVINIHVHENKLHLHVTNPIVRKQVLSTGIGLKNVKRRLQLLYPDRFQLSVQHDGTFFKVSLQLPV